MKLHIKKIVIALIIGLLYYVFVSITGLAIPCIFRLITGLKCPGCGISTLFIRLFHFDFKGAFYANQFIFVMMPFLIVEIVFFPIINKKYPKTNNIILFIVSGSAIVFSIFRNIYNF